MRTWGLIVGLLVTILSISFIFNIGNKMNEDYGVSVNDTWNEADEDLNTQYGDVVGEGINLSEKSPGGTNSYVGGATDDITKAGWSAGALIFQIPAKLKRLLLGDQNHSGIGVKFQLLGVDSRVINLIIFGVVLAIALLLLSSVLRNRL